MNSFLNKLRSFFIPEYVKLEARQEVMPLIYCVDCDEVNEATKAMRCSRCNSDATALITRRDIIQELTRAQQMQDWRR